MCLQVLIIENVTIITTETRRSSRTTPWISRSSGSEPADSASVVLFRNILVRGADTSTLAFTSGKISNWVSLDRSSSGVFAHLDLINVTIEGDICNCRYHHLKAPYIHLAHEIMINRTRNI